MADTPRVCVAVRAELLEHVRGAGAALANPHLTGCQPCQAFARTLSNAVAAERALMAEPADDAMLERVRLQLRPVIAETAQRRRRQTWALWPWAVGLGFATAIALVAGFVVLRERHAPEALDAVALIADDVSTGDTPAAATTLRRNARVRPGDALQIGGNLLVSLGPQRLAGAAATHLRFLSTDPRNVAVELTHGRIIAQVERVDGHLPTFKVTWPDADLVVTGTIFQVTANADGSEVGVARGHVRVHARDSDSWLDVETGSAVSLHHGSPIWRTLTDSERATMLEATHPGAALEVAPESSTATAAPLVDDHPVERAPSKGHTTPPARRTSPIEETILVEDTAHAGNCEVATQALGAKNLAIDARARGLVAVGDCFRGRGDADEALVWYIRAARQGDGTPAGENAAYEVGRMLSERGRIADADAAFAWYLGRYPRGTLAADASVARCSLAIQEQRADDALTCLRDYRERYPQSARLRDTFFLEATVLRTSKSDCAGAVRAYDAYLANPGTYAREAKSWKAWCESHGAHE